MEERLLCPDCELMLGRREACRDCKKRPQQERERREWADRIADELRRGGLPVAFYGREWCSDAGQDDE